MTPTDFAAALLKDVPHDYNENGERVMLETDVLAALSRALDPALSERAGEVLEGVTLGPWQEGELLDTAVFNWWFAPDHPEAVICEAKTAANARFIAWCRTAVPALLAQNAALRAERDEHRRNWERAFNTNTALEARAEAAEKARNARLVEAAACAAVDWVNGDYGMSAEKAAGLGIYGFVKRRAALTETATTEDRT